MAGLDGAGPHPDERDLEDAFIAEARLFADLHHISHRAWREFGVPEEVLRRAGIVHRD